MLLLNISFGVNIVFRSKRDSQQALSLGAETLGLLGRSDHQTDNGRDHMTKGKCQLRHQQAKVDVYTRFYAPQANTGKINCLSYFVYFIFNNNFDFV